MTVLPASEFLQWVRRRQDEMVDYLQQLVLAESPSNLPETQQPVFSLLQAGLESSGYQVQILEGIRHGGTLVAKPGDSNSRDPTQLLLGHCDTVWPVGMIRKMPWKIDDGRIQGPGVYDMKAGLVQIVFALRLLHEWKLKPTLVPHVLITSDEEIGSTDSEPHIRRLAKNADRVLVLEPSLGKAGRLKTARKGVGQFKIEITGKAAHAGLEPEAGRSAIHELSYLIQKLFDLNQPERGLSVNVGIVEGGLRPNVVAPSSRAVVDVRVTNMEDARRIEQAIWSLQPTLAGVTLKIEGDVGRAPLERTPRNQQLWRLARKLGQQLGMELEEGMAGGASDGNITSQLAPTLDGLGAVGGGAHATHEFVYLDKLAERTALLALLLTAAPLTIAKD